jgi:acetolactate synthase I/II/III large subunit
MKSSDLLVRCLEEEGVRWVFAVPGEENIDLLESIRNSSLELVVTRHEQGAGFMAATVGRLTGRPGVALSTLGPGATNLLTAAAYAQLGGMPMVLLTGQKPIRESKQGAFQILDVVGMMRPLAHYSHQVVSASYLPSRVREAFRRAASPHPGTAHLELPEDILRDETDARPIPAAEGDPPRASEESIERAVTLLARSRRPLLVLGAGANRARSCQELGAMVEELRIPFLTTQMGKGVVDESSPLYLGTAALSGDDFVHRAVDAADLIVNVGHSVVEKPPFLMRGNGPQVIHLDTLAAEVDPVYHPQVEVVGELASSVRALARALAERGWSAGDWAERAREVWTAQEAHLEERARIAGSASPPGPEWLVHELRQHLASDTILALDNGMYKLWFARSYPARSRHGLLLDNALATMGAGLPSAMAARLVYPDRPVVAVVGDGGLLMNGQEMETAVRLGLHLVVLVLRDDGYGMIRWKQEEMGLPDFGLSFGNPDFPAWARSYGAKGYRIGHPDELGVVLSGALEAPGVHLLELPVSYAEDHRILNEEIPERARKLELAEGASSS